MVTALLPDAGTPKADAKKPGPGGPLRNTNNHAKHQIQFLKKAVRKLGTRALDGRTRLARTLLDLRSGWTPSTDGF
jgi:hypothetical protein